MVGEVFTRLDGRAGYPDVLAACDRWRPDLVMHESTEFAGYLAAERRGIPHVRVGLVLGSSEDMITAVVPPVLSDLRAELGLAADPAGAAAARVALRDPHTACHGGPRAPGAAPGPALPRARSPCAGAPGRLVARATSTGVP